MPDTIRETTFKGNKMLGVLTGVGKDSTEYWKDFGLNFWQAVLENVDAIRVWVDRQENHRDHT